MAVDRELETRRAPLGRALPYRVAGSSERHGGGLLDVQRALGNRSTVAMVGNGPVMIGTDPGPPVRVRRDEAATSPHPAPETLDRSGERSPAAPSASPGHLMRLGGRPLTVQRKIFPMGERPSASMGAWNVAFANEIYVAAEYLRGAKGMEVDRFETASPTADPENYVIGHSDGERIWGKGSPVYDWDDLSQALVALGASPGMSFRLLGCSTGAGDDDGLESLASKTQMAVGFDVAGVTIKGAKDEMMKVSATMSGRYKVPGPVGDPIDSYESGFDHERKNAGLGTVQSVVVATICEDLVKWVEESPGVMDARGRVAPAIAGVLRDIVRAGGGQIKQDVVAGAKLIASINKLVAGFPDTGRELGVRSRRYEAFIAALRGLPDEVGRGLSDLVDAGYGEMLQTHDAWLVNPLKHGAVRYGKNPKGPHNVNDPSNRTFTD